MTKTKHQSTQILSEWHTFQITQTIIKCIQTSHLQENAITLSCHLSICGITQVYKKKCPLLLFLALQSLAARKPLLQLPSVFSVPRLTYPLPYTCKSLLMLGCLHCFHLVSGFRRFPSYILFVGWGFKPQLGAEKK